MEGSGARGPPRLKEQIQKPVCLGTLGNPWGILGAEKLAHSTDQISKHIEYVGPTIPLQPKTQKNDKIAHNKMLQNSSFGKSEKK